MTRPTLSMSAQPGSNGRVELTDRQRKSLTCKNDVQIPGPRVWTKDDGIAAILQALVSEYGTAVSSMRIGSRKRELWLMARDALDERRAATAKATGAAS